MKTRNIVALLATSAFVSVLGASAQAFEATDTSGAAKPELRAISLELVCHQIASDLIKQTEGQRCTDKNGALSVPAGSQITTMGGASVLAGNGGFTYQSARVCSDKSISVNVSIPAGATAKVGGVSIKAGAEVKCNATHATGPKR